MKDFACRLREGFGEVAKHAVGFDDILVQAMFAFATREHCFWLSEPGYAKSMVARMIFSLFPNSRAFCIQVTKDMLPSAIFGSEVPSEYIEKGVEIFNLDGGICKVEFAFLDEFLDGPDYLVRALNTALNERLFERKDQKVEIPLHSGIMTTNFNRFGTAVQAVRDRMMCKSVIPRPTKLAERMKMYESYVSYAGHMPRLTSLDYEELKEFADMIEAPDRIVVPAEIRLLHALMLREFEQRRIDYRLDLMRKADTTREFGEDDVDIEPISPRTEAKLNDFSRAAAAFAGRSIVQPEDLRAMRYGLVTINAGDGDELVWEQTCSDLLPNRKQLRFLQDLAGLALKVDELAMLPQTPKNVTIQVCGKAETFTHATLIQLLDKWSGENPNSAVPLICADLKTEIGEIGRKPEITKFPLICK